MKQFEEVFTDEKIIRYLCKVRVKIAKQRNKKHLLHILTASEHYNYHNTPEEKQAKYERDLCNTLSAILPVRKKWKKLGEFSRAKNFEDGSFQKISTLDKNTYSLLKTVKYFRENKPTEPFVIALNAFIKDIQDSVKDPSYNISTPAIFPKPKDNKKLSEKSNICRPISLFTLKDRIILSSTNNYLTRLFDRYFEDCSLAFRAKVDELVNHHTAIRRIIDYKKEHKSTALWAAECDMQKFYDAVDHKIIAQRFEELLDFAKTEFPKLDFTNSTRLFYSYLKCYSFNQDVLPLNGDRDYWLSYKIKGGEFGWIEKEIEHYMFYEDVSRERIGVPQGGALSGLITNIVLDIADKTLKFQFPSIFYIRFCDDMIIMHPDKEVCYQSIELYRHTLLKQKLAQHEFVTELSQERVQKQKYLPTISLKPFWQGKSKGPYKWDSIENEGYPWIGFVGYEIHHLGFIRIRKSSLEKELKKQKSEVTKIIEAIKLEQRKGKGTVTESAIKRLIGMSVSRVDLWNYHKVAHEMCWKNGFQEVNVNKYSIDQVKRLDRSRSKLYYDLVKACPDCFKIEDENEKKGDNNERQIVGYGKPFSYYYHIIERGNGNTEDDGTMKS